MRAMWKGAVSFGLVNVPVKLYSATENHDISFRQVHRADGGQIRYQRVCSVCGEQVPYEDVAKGYETEDGQMVLITDQDLAALPNQSSKEVAVEKFVPADQIDPILLDRSYYLEPEKAAVKAYALLRDALVTADRMALVTVSIRTRMTMAVLRVREGVIVLQTMLWPDEIRSADFANLGDVGHATDRELAMANMLVESLSGDFEPDELEDDYAAAVQELVTSKLAGAQPVPVAAAKDGSGEVVDLLEALQRSVDKAKAARGEPTAPAQPASGDKASEPPAKRARAAAAKEPAADTAPAKRPATKTAAGKASATSTAAARKATASGGEPPGKNGSAKPAARSAKTSAATAGAKTSAKRKAS